MELGSDLGAQNVELETFQGNDNDNKAFSKGKVMTYTACSGDDNRAGDEREAIVHADLKRGFPAMTREPEMLSGVCKEQGLMS